MSLFFEHITELWQKLNIVAILVIVVTFIFIRYANFILNKFFKIIHPEPAEEMEEMEVTNEEETTNLKSSSTSRFASTEVLLKEVLKVREAHFGSKPIVPDAAYHECWQNNRYSMKVVYNHNGIIGYWSVIPVNYDTFQGFLKGEITHEEMLTRHCLSWRNIEGGAVYLYIIGIVVPSTKSLKKDKFDEAHKFRAATVIQDFLSFGYELNKVVTIKGVCGYPSESNGYNLLVKTKGFKETQVLIDGDESQPIFVVKESDIPILGRYLSMKMKFYEEDIPKWNEADRKRFFSMIKK